ncbi:MAG: lyase family protein [Nocardioides sp.]
MSLLEPGGRRSGTAFGDAALLEAMIEVESAWLGVRGYAGLGGLVSDADHPELIEAIAREGEQAGNPVVPLVKVLRGLLRENGDEEQARAVHAGLTSQDVLDTALVLSCREAAAQADGHVRRALRRIADLAIEHRGSIRTGRTLTQPAVPTTFGLVAATWLRGLLDAAEDLARVRGALPVQLGGAAGTLAGPLVGYHGPDATAALAEALCLRTGLPWHSNRAPITRFGDALVGLHDACALIANDVLVGSRPEIGELGEGTGGVSSTMPHKHNPVLSVLIRSAGIAAPPLGATLHAAAAAQVDQRADGGWHAEWVALSRLTRSAVATTSRTADLLDGLRVRADRMRAHAEHNAEALLAEAGELGRPGIDMVDYLGDAELVIDTVVARAERYLATSENTA